MQGLQPLRHENQTHEAGVLNNALLQVYYSSTFHFQSRHTFVTKKLLKAQFQGILCM